MSDRIREKLLQELKWAKSKVASLERQLVRVTECEEFGHDWVFTGATTIGCCEGCVCSAPVYSCTRCAAIDYGDNADAVEIRKLCERDGPATF